MVFELDYVERLIADLLISTPFCVRCKSKRVTVVISKLLKRHSKANCRAPAYPRQSAISYFELQQIKIIVNTNKSPWFKLPTDFHFLHLLLCCVLLCMLYRFCPCLTAIPPLHPSLSFSLSLSLSVSVRLAVCLSRSLFSIPVSILVTTNLLPPAFVQAIAIGGWCRKASICLQQKTCHRSSPTEQEKAQKLSDSPKRRTCAFKASCNAGDYLSFKRVSVIECIQRENRFNSGWRTNEWSRKWTERQFVVFRLYRSMIDCVLWRNWTKTRTEKWMSECQRTTKEQHQIFRWGLWGLHETLVRPISTGILDENTSRNGEFPQIERFVYIKLNFLRWYGWYSMFL